MNRCPCSFYLLIIAEINLCGQIENCCAYIFDILNQGKNAFDQNNFIHFFTKVDM
jgi:hypothetical protein